MWRAGLIAVILLAVAIAVACGPSIRRTYQSDNAFVRCFDMDYNPARAVGDKEQCWSTWLAEHVYNQPDDKIAYAELRLTELKDGLSVPGPPGPEGAFDQRPEPTKSQPEPEEAAPEAEPEPAADETDAGPGSADGGAVELPASECEALCKKSHGPCAEACGDEGAAECAAACEAGYKACMRACFAD
jgi:hypothetical protein